ncbi:hypothetical protein [Acinetobacter haemolyticus]|uniref:hypothetical protein n=1 Tax=Acinetobacter haemolyticus TaxID=29430 RepID=UPI000D696BB2|nr:hypothetical protein [Acinetobacter haemolyticus]
MHNINIARHKKVCQAFADFQPIEINKSNPIFDLLNKAFYQENVLEGKTGCFMPIAFPTGVGKTYNTLSLILKVLLDDIRNEVVLGENYKPRYCYYITNAVDNVFDAFNSLMKSIDETDYLSQTQKDIVKERVLYAPANSRSLLDMLNNNERALDQLLDLFSITKNTSLLNEIKNLKSEQTILSTLKELPFKKVLSERLIESAQKCYSSIIRHIQNVQTGDKPIQLNEKNTNLLKLLIPGVTLEVGITRIVFMTTKKFLYGLQQSIGKFHPTRDLSENILIIDEVDRQHHEILTHLVAANEIDLLATIRTVHSNMKEHQLCSKLQYDGIAQLFEPYLKKVQDFFETYQLRHSFDIHQSLTKEKKQVLLFSDKLTTHNTNVNGLLKFSLNQKHLQHEIALKHHFEEEREESDFPKFVGKLERLVNREFQYLVREAEELYRKNLSRLPSEQVSRNLTSTQVISSILDQLNLHALQGQLNQHLNYLVGHQRSDRKSAANFHTRGIKMTEIDRLPESQDSVMFKHHGFNVTPTGMLASWVESGCHILGVSATAECGSVVHNFDIRYLKESLGTQYVDLTQFQRDVIHDYYQRERNYTQAAVDISIIQITNDRAYIKTLIHQWNPQARIENVLYKQLFGEDYSDYDFPLRWLSKLCQAISAFINTKNNRYMVGMLNRSIKVSLTPFLHWYVKNLEQMTGIVTKLVSGVDANYLKQGKFDEEVIKHLETRPGKVIVLTTYQTMSSGKNPDYQFDSKLENNTLRHVGIREANRTDIDYMYLEEPTNLISVNGSQESKTSDRLLLLSNAMGLQEVGAISPHQAHIWVNEVIGNSDLYNACQAIKKNHYHKSDDYLHATYRMIEQTVGRTARTAIKRETIYIAVDCELVTLLANDTRSSVLFSHEYKALVEYARTMVPPISTTISRQLRRQKNLAILHSGRSYSKIQSLLERINHKLDNEYEQDWKTLRQFVLKNPTFITAPIKNREYYIDSPTLDEYEYFAPKEEFKTNSYVFFENLESPIRLISESNSRLPVLMKNKDIREYFESVENEFCTEWLKGARYILTPQMYTNIYLGALGEEAGKAVLVKHGFQLEDIKGDQFEKFDSILTFRDKKIFIDFKYWDLSARRAISQEEQKVDMLKTIYKLRELHIDRLVICNIFRSNEEPILFFDENFKYIEDRTQASIMTIPNLLDELSGQVNINAITELARWMLN